MEKINDKRIKNALDFYVIAHKLKNLIRAGWKVWDIDAKRFESVAEHIYGTQMLAIVINSEFELNLDITKVVFMLAIHELGETIIGDISAFASNMTQEEKHKIERNAIDKMLLPLNCRDYVKNSYREFEAKETKEAQFAFFMDKLDCELQVKFYEETGCVDINKKREGIFKNLIEEGKAKGYKTFSETWIEWGRERYNYNDMMNEILDYVIKNDVYNLK